MLKYAAIFSLILFAVSCKKETVPTPNPPGSTLAVFSLKDASGNCYTINAVGEFKMGIALTSNNKLVLQVNVTTAGTYSISTGTFNGYYFTGSGTFTATGIQSVTLTGNGKPIIGGTNTISVTAQGSTCTALVSVTVPPVTFYDDNDHMYFGNPSNAEPNTDNFNNYLMRTDYNATSYSRDKGIPNWVSWHLYAADLGTASRLDDFRANFSLPDGWYKVSETSYTGSGFDKGHNTPSADRTSTQEANSSTFLMTNIIPQAPNNNQKVWAYLEDSLRRLANMGYEVYIIMGNYGKGGSGSNGYETTIDAGRVTVPSSIWKVAVILPNGNNDSSRVTVNTRVVAVNIPNDNDVTANWKDYRVSVDAIEAATGYNLLTRLPETMQAALEAKVDNQ